MEKTKGQRKREQILQKASELFIQKGYAGTSMDDLVQYSGFSKGSIYYHFKSKEDLFVSLIEHNGWIWIESWKQKKAKYNSFQELIYGMTDHFLEDFQNPLIKISEEFYISQSSHKEEILKRLIETLKEPRRMYEEIFEYGMSSGEIIPTTSSQDLAIVFAGLLNGMGNMYYEYTPGDLKNIYHKAVHMFLHGILD